MYLPKFLGHSIPMWDRAMCKRSFISVLPISRYISTISLVLIHGHQSSALYDQENWRGFSYYRNSCFALISCVQVFSFSYIYSVCPGKRKKVGRRPLTWTPSDQHMQYQEQAKETWQKLEPYPKSSYDLKMPCTTTSETAITWLPRILELRWWS